MKSEFKIRVILLILFFATNFAIGNFLWGKEFKIPQLWFLYFLSFIGVSFGLTYFAIYFVQGKYDKKIIQSNQKLFLISLCFITFLVDISTRLMVKNNSTELTSFFISAQFGTFVWIYILWLFGNRIS